MVVTSVPVSIYLHVPFCRIKCTYCAFNTYVNLDALIEPFIQALIHEIQIVGTSQPGQQVGTIYLGGGTPSMLLPEQIEQVLAAIYRYFEVLPGAEISMEANPDDLDRDYMAAVRAVGINRLSVGMQSANENELALFARRHDNDAVVRAVSAARLGGFTNLNLDLIYGFPHQTLETWENTLQQMLALQPEHISLYALGLEDGTPMRRWVMTGKLPMPDDDLAADMYELATEVLEQAGYAQYEISNWAKTGYACRHNLQYWYNLPYPGLGPGAHGYAGGVRYSTVLGPQKYIQLMAAANDSYEYPRTPATDQAVVVDIHTEIAETLLMGLRLTEEGIRRAVFRERFGVDLLEIHGPMIEKYANYGLLEVNADVVRLTRRGRLLSNVIFRELV
ncbi:MAG TPA: radical SAM family heme chaperone HemW [Phototrophicaceae bacterium]|nr:radical SAM family heme chaperone HemW [Phototrophicaceae bacterium]